MESDDDLDDKLNSIDEIAAAIAGLCSNDPQKQAASMEKADKMIKEKEATVNKTVVNQAAFDAWSSAPVVPQGLEQPSQAGTSQAGTSQAGPSQAGSSQAGPSQAGSSQEAGPSQAGLSPEADLEDLVAHDDGMNDPPADPNVALMAAFERDAKDRAERRKLAEIKSMKLKDEGNVYFKDKQFLEALDCYSKALSEFKMSTVLWTNRAQCYMMVQKYEECVEDCEWALRVNEACLKAFYIKGKALVLMEKFDEAKKCFIDGLEVEKKQRPNTTIMTRCLAEATRSEHVYVEEAQVKYLMLQEKWKILNFDEIVTSLLSDSDIDISTYWAGICSLKALITTSSDRVFFRLRSGLDLFHHPILNRLIIAVPKRFPADVVQLFEDTLDLMNETLLECEENQNQSLNDKVFLGFLVRLMAVTNVELQPHQISVVVLVKKFLVFDFIREKLLNVTEIHVMIPFFLRLARDKDMFSPLVLQLLAGFLTIQGFEMVFLQKLADIKFTIIDIVGDEDMDVKDLGESLVPISQILSNQTITVALAKDNQVMEVCLRGWENQMYLRFDSEVELAVGEIMQILFYLLYVQTPDELQSRTQMLASINKLCWDAFSIENQYQSYHMIVMNILSITLSYTPNVIRELATTRFVAELTTRGMALEPRSAIKLITMCTSHDRRFAQTLCNLPNCLEFLAKAVTSEHEVVAGNACLIISDCFEIVGGNRSLTLAARLACRENNSIMKQLLTVARDGTKYKAQKNASIAIAKLCRQDCRHLAKLHELNGLGILHSVLSKEKEEIFKEKKRDACAALERASMKKRVTSTGRGQQQASVPSHEVSVWQKPGTEVERPIIGRQDGFLHEASGGYQASGGSQVSGGYQASGGHKAIGWQQASGSQDANCGYKTSSGYQASRSHDAGGGYQASGEHKAIGWQQASGSQDANCGYKTSGGYQASGSHDAGGGYKASGGHDANGGYKASGGHDASGGYQASRSHDAICGYQASGGHDASGGQQITSGDVLSVEFDQKAFTGRKQSAGHGSTPNAVLGQQAGVENEPGYMRRVLEQPAPNAVGGQQPGGEDEPDYMHRVLEQPAPNVGRKILGRKKGEMSPTPVLATAVTSSAQVTAASASINTSSYMPSQPRTPPTALHPPSNPRAINTNAQLPFEGNGEHVVARFRGYTSGEVYVGGYADQHGGRGAGGDPPRGCQDQHAARGPGGHPDQHGARGPGGHPDQHGSRGPGGHPDQHGARGPGGHPDQHAARGHGAPGLGGYPDQPGARGPSSYPPRGYQGQHGAPGPGGYPDQSNAHGLSRYPDQHGGRGTSGYPQGSFLDQRGARRPSGCPPVRHGARGLGGYPQGSYPDQRSARGPSGWPPGGYPDQRGARGPSGWPPGGYPDQHGARGPSGWPPGGYPDQSGARGPSGWPPSGYPDQRGASGLGGYPPGVYPDLYEARGPGGYTDLHEARGPGGEARGEARDLGYERASEWVRDQAQEWARDQAQEWARDQAQEWAGDQASGWANYHEDWQSDQGGGLGRGGK